MSGSGYYTRLAAAMTAAAVLGGIIFKPHAGRDVVEIASAIQPERAPVSGKACAIGEAPLAGPFAPLDDVLSISPLGAVTAPGEPLPAPYLRINTRKGDTVFQRRIIPALAPARAEVTAIERRIQRNADGAAVEESWTVRLKPCDDVEIYYDRLDSIDPELLRRAGGLAAFTEIGGPDHIAIEPQIAVRSGDRLGSGDGFDLGLFDLDR